MKLTFIHGWGFDARFWDRLDELLPQFTKQRVDMGFFGAPAELKPEDEPGVLVGHSLGFIHGIRLRQDWQAYVAINSFARFVRTQHQPGCVEAAELRELRIGVGVNTTKALEVFYEKIEAHGPGGTPDADRLKAGLDELRDGDIGEVLQAIEAPGLVLAAQDDYLVPPKVTENLCGFVHNGGVQWNETGGHLLPMRDPVWCAKAIEDFLA